MTQTIKFHYIKSSDFKIVHVDGIFGGVTPTGEIFMAAFDQRPPIPQVIVQRVKESGELAEEVERVSKDGIIRDVHVGLSIPSEVAEAIIKWLQERLTEVAKVKEQQKEQLKSKREQ